MSLRARVLVLIGLLLLLILYGPSSVPGTAPCSQAIGVQYGLLSSFLPSAVACPGSEFTVTANPSSLTINPGATGISNISLTSISGFSGTVSLSTSPPPACPSPGCSSWSVNPVSLTLTPNGTARSTLTIQAGTSWPAPGGSANISIYGASGNLTRSAVVRFTISSSPDFSMSANPSTQTVHPGSAITSTILLTSINRFSGTVSLSTPLVPCSTYCWSINPMSVNLSAGGNASSTLTITTTTSIKPGNYSVSVFGSSGSLSHQVIAYFTVVLATPDFTISANPQSLTIVQGSSGSSTITVQSVGGFQGTVGLSVPLTCASLSCYSLSISPSSVTLTANASARATLTISTTSQTTTGSYSVPVTGASGSLSHNVTVSFTIVSSTSDFTVSAVPSSLGIPAGSCATSSITVTGVGNFNGTVSLTSSSSSSGLTTTISPSTLSVPPGGSATATLKVCTSSSTPSGSYTVSVTGTSGSLSHSVSSLVTVTSPNFTISATLGNLTINQGSSGTSTINVTSINGFAGTISLTALVSPTGSTAALNPASITLQAGGTGNSILTVSAAVSTPPGSYIVTVTATSGSISHTFQIGVTVLDPPASGAGGGGGGGRLM